ncbi:hypothetical protein [Edaphovirga cremea]|uniref:hypothetical protein n=1 Tax=Edaphovirga cremea TaxID=2267246 RepID=UPI000DEECAD6|nr:hypothetical protein [Edaphovirga cremea]
MDSNEKVKEMICNYEKQINEFRSSVNTKSIWLFLATLGCWGVEQIWIQNFAFFITFIFFTYQIHSKIEDKRSFNKIENDIKKVINTELDGDTQKARLYDLSEIKRRKHSIIPIIRSSFILSLSFIFFFFTVLHFANQ